MSLITQWRDRAGALARVALHSGAAFHARPRGLVEGARMRLSGPLSLPSVFRVHAAGRPDDPAVLDRGRKLSWGELDRRIDQLANGLRREHGLGRGDSAVLILRNGLEFLLAQAALGRLGGSAVSVSWRSTPDELAYLVDHCGARAVIADSAIADGLIAAIPRLTGVPTGNFLGVGATRPELTSLEALIARSAAERIDGEEGSVVIYTSGTTGKPKGAVRTFPASAAWAVIHALDELPVRVDDRHLVVCPMYHSTAFGFISFTLSLGGAIVIEPGFDPERFLAVIEAERITTTAVVPTMLHRLLELPEATRRRYDTRSLRAIFCGGAPLSGTLARRVIGELGHVLYNFYGSTETGLNTVASSDELLRSPGTIGHAVGGNEICLLDEQGHEVADGQTGELWVRNAMLVSGYHRDDAATEASMQDGFFSVGDLAHRDEHGLFHLDGRKRDMIITGGVNVYPAEVEEVLHRHPEVAEAAVVGVPDEEWGERVRVYVVARPGFEELEFLAWAKRHLAGPKVPREVWQLDALPKNPTGKVLKRELPTVR